MAEQLNIYQKLSKISNEIKSAEKDLQISIGGVSYKAVSESVILNIVKPLEEKYGVYSYPISRKIVDSALVETEGKNGKKSQFYERIETTYRFVNVDVPSEYIEIISYGDGIDNGDKSVGKAMTYADKYALMKAYKIVTGDDPDKNGSEENKITPKIEQPQIASNVSKQVKEQAELFNVSLVKLAAYLSKPITELTDEEVLRAIEQKRQRAVSK